MNASRNKASETVPKRLLRYLRNSVIGVVGILGTAAAWGWFVSAQKLSARYPSDVPKLTILRDSATIARGKHITEAMSCELCHGVGMSGGLYDDMGPLGVVAGPNLTLGEGGVGAMRTDEDFIRAIRFGTRRDSTSLMLMPSEVFVNMTDEDLASIISYLRSLAPVNNTVAISHFKPLGRMLLAAGKFNILVAPKTPRPTPVASNSRTPSVQYGRYLANISGCHGCHGYGLSGGKVAGPPGLPPASNLTPAGIGSWTEQDFFLAIREGRRKGGTQINEFMPYKSYRNMTDDELHSLWIYLQSVPSKPFGNK